MRFRWNGQEFEAPSKPTFAEIDYVEKRQQQPMDEWSPMTATRASIFTAVRRKDPTLLSWEASGEFSLDDVEILDDEDDQAPEDDAGPPAPSGSPGGPHAAAEPWTTADASTSSS